MRLFFLTFIVFLSGCTYFADKSSKIDTEIKPLIQDNISKAQQANTETVKSLIKSSVIFEINKNLQVDFPSLYKEIDFSLKSSNLSDSYIKRASALVGESQINALEIKKEVMGMLTNDTYYISKFAKESKKESSLIAEERENDQKLKNYGEIYEKERNESIIGKTKFWSFTVLGVVAIVLFFVYGWPIISALGIVPTAMSLIPKKTLIKKVRAGHNFLSKLSDIKQQELDKGDTSKVKLLESLIKTFKDLNRKEENDDEHKAVKKIINEL